MEDMAWADGATGKQTRDTETSAGEGGSCVGSGTRRKETIRATGRMCGSRGRGKAGGRSELGGRTGMDTLPILRVKQVTSANLCVRQGNSPQRSVGP